MHSFRYSPHQKTVHIQVKLTRIKTGNKSRSWEKLNLFPKITVDYGQTGWELSSPDFQSSSSLDIELFEETIML